MPLTTIKDSYGVEQEAIRLVKIYFEQNGYVSIDMHTKELQMFGDFHVMKNGEISIFELKAEQKFTGNFFIETWSNRKWGKVGWIHKIKSDRLLYVFLDKMVLYDISVRALRSCLFDNRIIYNCEMVEQGKCKQKNDTWGHKVPIKLIENKLGNNITKHNLFPF